MSPLKQAMHKAVGKNSNCPECGKRVSNEDESCPHCGCDLTEMEDEDEQDVDGEGSSNMGEIVQYWSRNPR